MQKPLLPIFVFLLAAVPLLCGFSGDVTLSDIQTAFMEQDYQKAQQLAEALIATKPPQPRLLEVQYYLALSQLNLGKHSEAQGLFEEILSAQPQRNLRDRAELGVIDSLLLQGNFKTALKKAERLLQQSTQSEFLSLIYFKIGRAHFKMAQWDDATNILKFLTTRFPDSPEARLAQQLLEEKHYFAVQVGSFRDQGLAEKMMQDLRAKDKYVYIVETVDKDGQTFYRVRVGQFSRLDQAMALARRLSQLGYPTLIYP